MHDDDMESLLAEMDTIGAEAEKLVAATDPSGMVVEEPLPALPGRPRATPLVRGTDVAKLAEAAVLAERLAKLLRDLADASPAVQATEETEEESEPAPPASSPAPRMVDHGRLYAGARERARGDGGEDAAERRRIEERADAEAPMASPDESLEALVKRTSLDDPDPVATAPEPREEEKGSGVRDLFGPDFDVDYEIP